MNPQNYDNRFEPKSKEDFAGSFISIHGYDYDYLYDKREPFWVTLPTTPSSSSLWELPRVTISIEDVKGSFTEYSEGDFCITLNSPKMFLLSDSEDFDKQVNNYFCFDDSCSNIQVLSDAPEIKVTIKDQDQNEHSLIIDPEDYIYLKSSSSSNYTISSEDILPYYGKGCKDGAKIGVGMQFFIKFYMMFEVNKKKTTTDNELGESEESIEWSYKLGFGQRIPVGRYIYWSWIYSVNSILLVSMILIYILKSVLLCC